MISFEDVFSFSTFVLNALNGTIAMSVSFFMEAIFSNIFMCLLRFVFDLLDLESELVENGLELMAKDANTTYISESHPPIPKP